MILVVNDSINNVNQTDSTFTITLNGGGTPSSSGGGGGAITIIDTLKERLPSVCDDSLPPFQEALSNFREERTFDNFIKMWYSYWNYSLCKSGASIIPT